MTEPLTPPDLDLRDFPYMPLDVVRLRDSDASVICSGEEFRAAVLLWCAAWHQVPAASLPNDDRLLANLAGFGRDLESWKAAREGALRGFIECSDGRLYHPVIAEKAIDAWAKKWDRPDRAAERSEHARKAAAARWGHKNCDAQDMPEHMPEQCPEDALKGIEGKGKETKKDTAGAVSSPPRYFFESGVIRLTEPDFKKWEQAFTNLDLRAELIGLTQWAGEQPKWFFAVSGALTKRNREIGLRARAGPTPKVLSPFGTEYPDGII